MIDVKMAAGIMVAGPQCPEAMQCCIEEAPWEIESQLRLRLRRQNACRCSCRLRYPL